MFDIDSIKCTGCGNCIGVCPQQAITIHDDLAIINEDLCIQCGICAEVCPVGAIREVVPTYAQIAKGGDNMVYGYGRGLGRRGGAGFGFRGSSPPWPYFGRGRGGLPRCWYPGVAMASPYPPVPPAYAPQMPQGQEIGWLKSQAEAIKAELNQVEARIQDLGSAK
ncbi:NAD(P)H-quinone oxidoreductase subunit I, chloroplastic [subsurface metagenome]